MQKMATGMVTVCLDHHDERKKKKKSRALADAVAVSHFVIRSR